MFENMVYIIIFKNSQICIEAFDIMQTSAQGQVEEYFIPSLP